MEYITHIPEMEAAVANGTVLAGLVSGEPENLGDELTAFSSGAISPRAALLAHCADADSASAAQAINAAIRAVSGGGNFVALQDANHPFQAAAAFTCAPVAGHEADANSFPDAADATGVLKDILDSGVLKVAALGPYDWGVDGNYTNADEPTGFWPDYLSALVAELAYGMGADIALERVYAPSSAATLQLLLDGEAHVSEPYFATNGLFGGLPRQDAFHMSCTTVGYDSTFFTRNEAVLAARGSAKGGVSAGAGGKDDGVKGGDETVGAGSLRSLATLRAHLSTEGGAVAFIGEGNYHSVRHVLPPSVEEGGLWEVVYIEDADELEAAVASGAVTAGLVSGEPEDVLSVLNTFSAGTISPRAALLAPECVAPSNALNSALSAAIMHVQATGGFRDAVAANHPFEAAAMFTCAVQEGTFPNASLAEGALRDVLDTGVLKVAALGPYDWGVDGNYTNADEPTGFWPDYLSALVAELAYGMGADIALERVYAPSSAATLQLLLDGEAHVSEPYFATNGLFGGLPRQDAFHMSCTTVGYDSTFFTRNEAVLAARGSAKGGVSAGAGGKDDGVKGGDETVGAGSLRSLATLRAHLSTEGGAVAFIGEGNYHSVRHVLPPSVEEGGLWEVVYIEDADELEAAVASGAVTAGLVSGEPEDVLSVLNTFSAGTISPRAALLAPECVAPSNALNSALSAAIMHVQATGGFRDAVAANHPFEAAAMFTCAVQEGTFPNASLAEGALRDVLDTGVLKVAALGPYDWGVDGDYTADKPTGFWPDYLSALVAALADGMGAPIAMERVYAASSADTLQLLLDGEAHISEPYFATNGLFDGVPRQDAFHMSCTTLGYDSTFFTRNEEAAAALEEEQAADEDEKLTKKQIKQVCKKAKSKKKCKKGASKKVCSFSKTKGCTPKLSKKQIKKICKKADSKKKCKKGDAAEICKFSKKKGCKPK